MPKSAEEILELYTTRLNAMGKDFARMRLVSQVVNGDIVIPLPELHQNERASVPNLTQQGLDQLSRRIASVMPLVFFPTLGNSDAQAKAASDRNRVSMGWWSENRMKKKLGRRARWYLGYASAPIVIKPGPGRNPKWVLRHPLNTFPADTDIDEFTPIDCCYHSQHTYRWLLANFPQQSQAIRKPSNWDAQDTNNLDVKFDVVEYNSPEEDTLILCGYDKQDFHPTEALGSPAETLLSVPNRAGIPWGVIPGRIVLDKPLGHFDGILGMYQTMAELMAMQIIATKRAIWPREWLVANPGETPKVITVPDPNQGRPGTLSGGKLERQVIDPSLQAIQVSHELENSQRQTAGLPSELGGQSATNIRTGRRGAQVLGAAIDFTIQEANDIFAESLYEENLRAIKIDKAYFDGPKKYHIITRSFQGTVNYTPSKLWESDKHVVDYPFAGVDLQNLPVEGGQRVAMETLSQETFMEFDPMVPDNRAEMQRIWVQKARRAWFTSFETQASMPDGPYRPEDISRIITYIKNGDDPEDAVEKYNLELQELQASQPEPLTPEAMPGLAPQGAPGEVQPSIPEAEPSLSNMQGLLSRMATTQTAQAYRK